MTLSRFRHGGYVFIGVSKFVVCAKTTQPIFIKFSGKMAHELRKKPLDFDGKPDHSTLGLGRTAMISVAGRCMGSRQYPATLVYFTQRLFHNNFSGQRPWRRYAMLSTDCHSSFIFC